MTAKRRRAQSGTTLVELVVALFIAGLALALVIGTISSGLLNATLAKRNTAVQAVMQYETEQVGASTFSSSAANYSDCFAVDNPSAPAAAAGFQQACPDPSYSLRADVSWQWMSGSSTVQVWTIQISGWPSGASIGAPVQVLKVTYT
jgi:type II secretory pathway pseudopilin PulG